MSIDIVITNLQWDGSELNYDDVRIIRSVKCRRSTYLYVEIATFGGVEFHWVIRRQITDLRPVVANDMKGYFHLPKLLLHTIRKNNKNVTRTLLIKTNVNPLIGEEEVPLMYYYKHKLHSDAMVDQVIKTYAFRILMGMSLNDDNSLVVRKEGTSKSVYSLYDTFPPSNILDSKNKEYISDTIYNKWFEPINITMTDAIERLIGSKMPNPYFDNEMNDFVKIISDMEEFIDKSIKRLDPDLIWYSSDVTNFTILRMSP